jgi:hypothetical protein
LTPDRPEQSEARRGRIRLRLWTVCFAIFAFEIGAFLIVFPWIDAWSFNHLPSFFPNIQTSLQDLWDDPFLKGGVSGLGFLNVYIALKQVASLVQANKQR